MDDGGLGVGRRPRQTLKQWWCGLRGHPHFTFVSLPVEEGKPYLVTECEDCQWQSQGWTRVGDGERLESGGRYFIAPPETDKSASTLSRP